MKYAPHDPRLADLPGMVADADMISEALDGHMRAATDPKEHAMLHRLRAALRSFVEVMSIELPKYEAHSKAAANVHP